MARRKRFKRSESQRRLEKDFPLWLRHCNPIENQGPCNSCYAFAACCVLEVMLNEHSNEPIRLSKQHLYNHLVLEKRFEGLGKPMAVTLDFMKEFGCVLERDCPYLEYWEAPSQHRGYRKSWCRPASYWMVVVKVDEWKELYFEHVFKHLREVGPVICEMEWTPELEDLRKGFVYRGGGVKYPTVTNEDGVVQTSIHFLVIVGYGRKWIQNDLVTYYTIRNSTGTEWSDSGYGRIEAKQDLFSCFWGITKKTVISGNEHNDNIGGGVSKIIWDEVGEAEPDRDRMLFELEQECLEVYRRKVDQANRRQAIAECEAELAAICSTMGERPVHIRQSDRLKKVQEHHLYALNSLCSVLGFDFQQTVLGIHPNLGDIEGPTSVSNDTIQQAETTCGSLLYELQIIWDEVGEAEPDRDRMLFELEQECLEVYRRKVDQANRSRAQLRQAIADCEAELAAICSAMGERPVHIRQSDQNAGSLKVEHARILPYLEEMKKQKFERRNQFIEVQEQIQNISIEIYGPKEYVPSIVDETDLSLRKLEELHRQLNALQSEKSDRLKKVQEHLYTLNSLCSVLGFDFMQTVLGIHPSLGDIEGPTSVNNDTIQQLAVATQKLREIKLQRMQKLQDLATTMLELWNLMDTPIKEQQMFQNVACNIAASEDEITEPNTLSADFINCVEVEVSRLEELKSSKMKELVLKKRTELEEICRKTHLVPETDGAIEYAVEDIESGAVDPACVLEQFERQVAQVKEEALGRKDILEKVEKWLAACDEESWLEEYNRDDNRYNTGRGAHLTLKRAEKARGLVNKIPAMVDVLTSKTIAWEKERGVEFTYDGIRLLSIIEEYNILREEKEQERRRQRDLKKLQGQMIAEQEALYGSKPSPSKPQSVKKGSRMSTGGAASRRVSLGGAMLQTPKPDSKATNSRAMRKTDKVHQFEQQSYLDDGASCLSSASRRVSLGGAMLQTPKPDSKATNSRATRKTDKVIQFEQQSYLDDGASCLSPARRGLDIAGIPVQKHSLGAASAQGIESPLTRQPFASISSNVSSKANVANAANELSTQKTLSFTSSCKAMTAADLENIAPKAMPIPIPATPSTVSVPMSMALTPVPSSVLMNMAMTPVPSSAPFGCDMTPPVQEIEYSFEERRLAHYMLA